MYILSVISLTGTDAPLYAQLPNINEILECQSPVVDQI